MTRLRRNALYAFILLCFFMMVFDPAANDRGFFVPLGSWSFIWTKEVPSNVY